MAKPTKIRKSAPAFVPPWTDPLTNACILIVGLGAIGSFLASLVARIEQVGRIILVDFDTFDSPRNVMGQLIELRHMGRKKVDVVAESIRAVRPDIEVIAIDGRLQAIPMGRLAADVILSALDTKIARQLLSEVAYRMGAVLIDAGVLASMSLVRVSVMIPGASNACVACAYTADDYRHLEIEFSCMKGRHQTPSTNSPAYLASLAASLQAAELEKMLLGRWGDVLVGRELIVSAADHGRLLSHLRRNPDCRFDHVIWDVQPGPALSATAAGVFDQFDATSLSVAGGQFACALSCAGCGLKQPTLRFVRNTADFAPACESCGAQTFVSPLDWARGISIERLDDGRQSLTLGRIGLEEGDILIVAQARGAEIHRKIVT